MPSYTIKKPYTFEKKAKKVFLKLDKKTQDICTKKLDGLYNNPIPRKKSHIINVDGEDMFCELPVGKIRIYYLLKRDRLIILSITIIEIHISHKSGKSGQQQKDINRMKKNLKRNN